MHRKREREKEERGDGGGGGGGEGGGVKYFIPNAYEENWRMMRRPWLLGPLVLIGWLAGLLASYVVVLLGWLGHLNRSCIVEYARSNVFCA